MRLAVSSTLVTASRQWRRMAHQALSAYGVSEACAAPLLIAGRLGEGVRQVTLARHVGIEGPSLVRLLDQLCAAGLMCRHDDPADGRAKTVSLTDLGRAVTGKAEIELDKLRAERLKGVTKEELGIALRVLHAFETEPVEPRTGAAR